MRRLVCHEYGQFDVSNRVALEQYLISVWKQRHYQILADELNHDKFDSQGFLKFDGKFAKAQNFIGFIQTEDIQIEIYPKVFKGSGISVADSAIYLQHIFYWFSYCRKWKFPFTNNNLELDFIYDLPELIINLMADRLLEVVSASPITLYQESEEQLAMPRGRINFTRYVSSSLSKGNIHLIECDTEPLVYDNNMNRAIKYVCRILQGKAKFTDTLRKVENVLFILDEVEDAIVTSRDLHAIKINLFYQDYQEVVDICRLVLDQQLYSNQYNTQRNWCLLFPMEYVFEDFVAGFLETHFSNDWVVEYQKSDLYLTDEYAFQMQHDIILTNKKSNAIKVIVDTKYKLRSPEARAERKRGISQADMYQMTSYAFRRGCDTVLLLYPNEGPTLQPKDKFTITSKFECAEKVKVTAAEIPFWDIHNFSSLERNMKSHLKMLLDEITTQYYNAEPPYK